METVCVEREKERDEEDDTEEVVWNGRALTTKLGNA